MQLTWPCRTTEVHTQCEQPHSAQCSYNRLSALYKQRPTNCSVQKLPPHHCTWPLSATRPQQRAATIKTHFACVPKLRAASHAYAAVRVQHTAAHASSGPCITHYTVQLSTWLPMPRLKCPAVVAVAVLALAASASSFTARSVTVLALAASAASFRAMSIGGPSAFNVNDVIGWARALTISLPTVLLFCCLIARQQERTRFRFKAKGTSRATAATAAADAMTRLKPESLVVLSRLLFRLDGAVTVSKA